MNKILIVDDEVALCEALEFVLEDEYEVQTLQNPSNIIRIIDAFSPDVVLLDLKIGEANGIDVLKTIKKENPNIEVIIMTAFGSIDSTVEAIKIGAFNYLIKPVKSEELKVFIKKAIEYRNLNNSFNNLRMVIEDEYSIKGVIGRSNKFVKALETIHKIKDFDSTVLILGESGTGKDVIAKALHFESPRRSHNLEIVNCAAIPSNLLESELFGYEKGAFTGADRKRIGRFELAHQGTIFLDEIGEMDLSLQAKILRVVEDMTITPIGSEKRKQINVRVIAATNRDLNELIKSGQFREDLYYRLNVIAISLPPLRERKEDISLFVKYFLDKFNKKFCKNIVGFDIEAYKHLENYYFPGNIRELENLMERIVALSDQTTIDLKLLSNYLDANYDSSKDNQNYLSMKVATPLKTLEKLMIESTLDYFNGNRGKTAAALQISERKLLYKIKEYEFS
ncbi:sigma-54-dependent transcriptional regulator [Acidaminobacter hydrogenoformans]|uniref:Stage 0 sporulation protein A homolog n=1 Tax=Acidaminobacter hydrogenoformans DSM 2784 TaxID=1120920 RepID=A0A1G5S6Q6_9FIRM|nr:sigma-54 dependent transcriptional regulator [Acidaminobacter hydrogenoformans]SCZ82062.1 two-component system, NtrC family, response regulator AtoC [Acidaminobacter hydrogenoformans DSM 2784]